MSLLKDFWDYLKERKKWWLLPTIIVLFLFGILIVLSASGSAIAPIYLYSLLGQGNNAKN